MKDIVELGEKVGAEPYPEYDEEKKEYKYPRRRKIVMKLSECCDAIIILTDICSSCKEHCDIYEDNNDNRE